MAYTTIDDPTAYFQTAIWSGTGSALSVTFDGNSDMQPDLVWVKNRTTASDHRLSDSVRGTSSHLVPNDDAAIDTSSTALTAFNSDGFSVGSEQSYSKSGSNHVGWGWKAGTSFTNDASSTSIGSIDSAGSVSDISGFSIVSFTGTGSNGTIKHGLSTAPNLFIIKRLDADNDFRIGSSALTNFVKHVNLNTTAAESDLAVAFNSTGPTTSVFSVGTSISVNASGGTYIAYCFSSIKGYSKFGSYPGNGNANGPFIFLGFKPAFIMIKGYAGTDNWIMVDNKRSGFNSENEHLDANNSDVESDGSGNIDFLSNGFKIRSTFSSMNYATGKYLYMAFAEQPFVTSTGVPATAR